MTTRRTQRIPPAEISANTVYFAFLDGALTYDCKSCNATCCRGHGYLLDRQSEKETHFQYRRNLHLFVEEVSGNFVTPSIKVNNCPPACFFLTEDGLCGIHLEHGHAAKPETCRLFPFNYFCWAGKQLVVSPHPSLCPLEITPPRITDNKSRHDALLREMQRQGITSEVPVCCEPENISMDELLDLERAIRAVSQHYESGSSYAEFAVAQLTLTYSRMTWAADASDIVSNEPTVDELQSFIDTVIQLLGVSISLDDQQDSELTRAMVVVTPLLRSHYLFQNPSRGEGKVTTSLLLRLPYVLLTIYVLAMAARAAGMTAITVQTICHLSRSFDTLLLMVSDANQVMVWKPGVLIPTSMSGNRTFQDAYIRVAKALLAYRQERRRCTLDHIVSEHCAFQSTDRIQFLTLLSRALFGRIVSMAEADLIRTRFWTNVRCSIQRFALAITGEERLSATAAPMKSIDSTD